MPAHHAGVLGTGEVEQGGGDAVADHDETYLSANGDCWSTQDLSAKYGTPAVAPVAVPEGLYHTGFTSAYTINASGSHVQETYRAAMSDAWRTQDLSQYGAQPAALGNSTPDGLSIRGSSQ